MHHYYGSKEEEVSYFFDVLVFKAFNSLGTFASGFQALEPHAHAERRFPAGTRSAAAPAEGRAERAPRERRRCGQSTPAISGCNKREAKRPRVPCPRNTAELHASSEDQEMRRPVTNIPPNSTGSMLA
ncbi:uncharacterized protein LOC144246340 [Lonchura striata]